MASSNPAERKQIASGAAFAMWAGVADPAQRLRNAHDNSPSGYLWHARRLFDPDLKDLDGLTPKQKRRVEKARTAWYKANAVKATRARKLKRAQRLRAQADAIEAEAAGDA